MIESDVPTNKQARQKLAPTDPQGQVVVLDPGSLHVEQTSGNGTFEVNDDTNEAVFRPEDDATGAPVSEFHCRLDGAPGPGESFLEWDVKIRATAVGAVSAGESLELEDKGTPA